MSSGLSLVWLAAAAGACGQSDSQVGTGGGSSGGPSSSSGATTSSGGGGSSTSTSGSSSTGGSTGSGMNTCPAQTSLVTGAKLSIPVSWPASGVTQGGNGTALIWQLVDYTMINGNMLSGTSATCKLVLPDVILANGIAVLLGGSKIQIQIPPSAWAKTPTFPITGTQGGWGPPNAFTPATTVVLVGLKFPQGTDPSIAWPSTPAGFPAGTMFPDDDKDNNPGITGTPLSGNGYVQPPTDILATAKADQVYIASRNEFGLAGKWTDCNSTSGTATAKLFDNHVVGCHVAGGGACTTGPNSQAQFIDSNRTVYTPSPGTFTGKVLSSTATCADVINALP
jgi:hypothetical protein